MPLDIRPNPLNTAISLRLRRDGAHVTAGQGGLARSARTPLTGRGAARYPAVPPPVTTGAAAAPRAALQSPAREGTMAAVEMLLEGRGGSEGHADVYWSGLHWPALGGHRRLMKRLLERGGDPSSPGARGYSPPGRCSSAGGSWSSCSSPTASTSTRSTRTARACWTWWASPMGDRRRAGEGEDDRLAGGADGARPRGRPGDARVAAPSGATSWTRSSGAGSAPCATCRSKAPELFERELVRDELLHWCRRLRTRRPGGPISRRWARR